MSDQLVRFGASGDTSLSALTLAVFLLTICAIFMLPMKKMLVPLVFASILLPISQQIVIGGINLMVFRLLLVAAWIRVATSASHERLSWNSIDKALVWWAIIGSITFVALWGAFGAVIQRLGFLYNTFGFYFLFRLVVRDQEDADRMVKVFATACAVLAVFMIVEKATGRNYFTLFGGVSEYSFVREGKIRAQAGFAHPILAGTFGAILWPLFAGLRWEKKSSGYAWLGMISAAIMTIASSSSTSLMALVAGFGALYFLWPVRKFMRPIRWAIVISLVTLHMVMKAPVWALISRVDVAGGSSSDHRYQLVNQTIMHFKDWWAFGIQNVSSWGFEMGDTSNAYVEACVTGGLINLILFIAVIAYGFKEIGTARRKFEGDPILERRIWAVGAAMFANVVAYMGITYFDQTIIAWYGFLAIIPAMAAGLPTKKSNGARAAVETEQQLKKEAVFYPAWSEQMRLSTGTACWTSSTAAGQFLGG